LLNYEISNVKAINSLINSNQDVTRVRFRLWA
jgi:hypothetical protein